MSNVERVLGVLEELLRDVTLLASESPLPLLHEDRRETLELWAQRAFPSGLSRCVRAVHDTRGRLSGYANGRLAIDALLALLARELGLP